MTNLEELTRRWFTGWQAARALPAALATDDALWIHCKQTGREFEAFTLHADDDPASVARVAAEVLARTERTWLTATTTQPQRTMTAIESAGLEIMHRAEWFMSVELTGHPQSPLDPAYTSEIRVEGSAITVTICDGTGELAARGSSASPATTPSRTG